MSACMALFLDLNNAEGLISQHHIQIQKQSHTCRHLILDLNMVLGNKALSIAKCCRPSKNGYPNYPILEAMTLSDHQKVEQYVLLERVVQNSLGILRSCLLLPLLLQ